jgi:hypothetical protein
MKQKNIHILVISIIIYFLGFASSMAFNSLSLWANLEGQSFWGYPEALAYDSSLTREARLYGVRCPMLLTPGETGSVTIDVRNPNDYPIEAWVSTHISMPGMFESMARDLTSVSLAPGERSTLRWEVSEENVIRNRIILVRAFLRLTDRHPPSRTSHCGIVALDLWGLPSNVVMILALVGGHLVQAVGIWSLWQGRMKIGKKDNFLRNILIALSIFSILMTMGSLLHSWVIGLMGLLLALLLAFTAFGYRIGQSDIPSN